MQLFAARQQFGSDPLHSRRERRLIGEPLFLGKASRILLQDDSSRIGQ